jgi:hypothetical protein
MTGDPPLQTQCFSNNSVPRVLKQSWDIRAPGDQSSTSEAQWSRFMVYLLAINKGIERLTGWWHGNLRFVLRESIILSPIGFFVGPASVVPSIGVSPIRVSPVWYISSASVVISTVTSIAITSGGCS